MRSRFFVLYNGKERQLLSVRQGGDKSLYIFQDIKNTTYPGGQNYISVKSQKISVHSEMIHEGERCHKIKFDILSEDGDNFDRSLIVRKGNIFIFPVVSVVESKIPYEIESISKKKDKCKSIKIFGYIGDVETLCYTIFSHSSAFEMPNVQGFTKVTEKFSQLSITLYLNFMHVPDKGYSLIFGHLNGGLRKNGILIENSPEITNPMPERHVQGYLQYVHTLLAEKVAVGQTNDLRLPNIPNPRFRDFFDRWPRRSDELHENYGEYSKRKSKVYQDPFTLDGIRKTPEMLRDELQRMMERMRFIAQNDKKSEEE